MPKAAAALPSTAFHYYVFTRHLIHPITCPNVLVFHQNLVTAVEFELVYQVYWNYEANWN